MITLVVVSQFEFCLSCPGRYSFRHGAMGAIRRTINLIVALVYRISDPEKAVIVIENVYNAINQISQTTVRNVVGRFNLDQLLSDTASINEQIKNVIDGHTEPWGTQVTALEIKDITLPDNMQRAMAKEAAAERERRAKIVAAEGEYQAS